jgi:GntR family transcriptional regulator
VTQSQGAPASRPLWQQVLDDLERRIAAGDIVDRFPTDKELTEHYGVSRHTVREAVQRLRSRGLVDRHRGRGSFLNEGVLTQPLGGLYSLFRAVEEAGLEQRSEVRFLGLAHDAEVAARLELPADAELVRLERLRYAGAEPLALDETWLPADIGRPVLDVDLTHTALYDVLSELSALRLTAADETLTPIVPDAELAALLELEDLEGLLRVERLARSGARAVEFRITLLRGQRFRYSSAWRADDGAAPTTAFVDARELD